MAVDVSADLDRAIADLRAIDSDLSVITGRGGGALSDRINRKRPAANFSSRISFDGNERRVQEVGDRRRITISVGNDNNEPGGRLLKRVRYSDSREGRNFHEDDEDDREPPIRRSIQSSVVMPTIETKSREVVLNEMKKKEKREDVARNRNLFGRLLVGTLKQFQKEEKAIQPVETVQAQKQREVERRLELTKKEDLEKVRSVKEELLAKRREKEKEIQKLNRMKAITQYAEEKIKHYERLQNYIQTQTKPPLFYLPAKHTLRTLELLKNSSKKIDSLIGHRRDQMEKELRKDEEGSEGELDVGPVRSKVVTASDNKAEEAASANIEDLEEPKLEEPMEEDEAEEKDVVKVRVESPVNRTVESKVNGNKSGNHENENEDRGYSSDENSRDVVSASQKRNSRDSRSRSKSNSSSNGASSGSASGDEN
uniref:Pinin/SDK/MemA protein domain-containing protein n=1 Tax=Acrobeloides nanus TaxID=290746 RepID=A0A914C0E0_9BILA